MVKASSNDDYILDKPSKFGRMWFVRYIRVNKIKDLAMNTPVKAIEAQVVAMHFALSRLWVREFQRSADPATEARQYADGMSALVEETKQHPGVQEALVGFFEQIAFELGDATTDG